MKLNRAALLIMTRVRAQMYTDFQRGLVTTLYKPERKFICVNIMDALLEYYGAHTFDEVPPEGVHLEVELRNAINSAINGKQSFDIWLDHLVFNRADGKLRLQLLYNKGLVQMCRLAWLDRIIETQEIK